MNTIEKNSNDVRLRMLEVRSLWNQRLIWIIIATDLLLHAQRFLSQW